MANTTWKAWFDGATQGSNPGVRGIGGLLLGPSGERIEIAEEIGMGTNNEAEYMALMAVLDAAIEVGAQHLEVFGDSQLVINQVNGAWFIKAKELLPLSKTVIELKAQIAQVTLRWIPREENSEADALSKKALGIIDSDAIDRTVWMKIADIARPFGLSSVALGKKMTKAGLRHNGKPTELAVQLGCVLRIPNRFGHDDYWHRQLVPAVLRKTLFLD